MMFQSKVACCVSLIKKVILSNVPILIKSTKSICSIIHKLCVN